MVVQRRHQQQAAAFTVFFACVFEIHHLQHDREGFGDKHAAHHGQHNFLAHDHSYRAQRTAQGQSTDIAHKDLCRVRVEP